MSTELDRRAAQLTSRRHRRLLAAALERTLEAAERPGRGLSPAVPIQRSAVHRARAPLAQLAADLAGDDREQVSSARPTLSARGTVAGSIDDMTDERCAVRGVALLLR